MKTKPTLLFALLLAPLAANAVAMPMSEKGCNPFSNAICIGVPAAKDAKFVADVRYAFRHGFALDQKPVKASVRITADARYILWLNGVFVGRGPSTPNGSPAKAASVRCTCGSTTATEVENQRVSLFERGIWLPMVEGAAKYAGRKAQAKAVEVMKR